MGPIALSKAMDVLTAVGHAAVSEYEHALVRSAYRRMSQVTGLRMYVTGERLGHVIPFDIDGFDSRLIATVAAAEHGIGLRAGAFCTYEYIRKLKGISDDEDRRIAAEVDHGIIRNIPQLTRVSFSICNPPSDVDALGTALDAMVGRGVEHYLGRYVQDDSTGAWTPRS